MADKTKVLDIFKALLDKVGIADTDADAIEILSDSALQSAEISTDLATRLNTQLISMDTAKNHIDLKKTLYRTSNQGL